MMNTAVSLAEDLNQHCACHLLDTDALAHALRSDSVLAQWWPHWQETHAHLFAATGLFVSQAQLQAMHEAVAVLHGVMQQPLWLAHVQTLMQTQSQGQTLLPQVGAEAQVPHGVFMGYDFHLSEDGPKLIEINTNAGGAMLNLALTRAQHACCHAAQQPLQTATRVDDLEEQWLEMFASEWALQRPQQSFIPSAGPHRTLAIVDESPATQYLYPEFLLFEDLFRRAGIDARVLDPAQLQWRAGQLWHEDCAIDMVYLRLTDFDLSAPAHTALRQAWQTGACVFTPGPQTHALHANKQHLVALSDVAFMARFGLSAQAQQVLANVVPHTQLLTSANSEQLWAQRKHYFFKPLAGYGSKATYRGDKLTHKTWAQMQNADYVAQALIPPSQRVVMVGQARKQLKADVRAYAYKGQVQLFAARLYDGQTTNFRSDGGGFAPVFVTPN